MHIPTSQLIYIYIYNSWKFTVSMHWLVSKSWVQLILNGSQSVILFQHRSNKLCLIFKCYYVLCMSCFPCRLMVSRSKLIKLILFIIPGCCSLINNSKVNKFHWFHFILVPLSMAVDASTVRKSFLSCWKGQWSNIN